jgi:SlyX protein
MDAMSQSDPQADRLESIEIKLAHLERALGEISDVVARQQNELDRALARQQRLTQQLETLESAAGPAGANHYEKPPHY